jgi:PPOX class probable FMN-dependent enzyme
MACLQNRYPLRRPRVAGNRIGVIYSFVNIRKHRCLMDDQHPTPDPHRVADEAALRALYGHAEGLAVRKSMTRIDRHARDFIARAPFLCIATSNAQGRADVSPRGDQPGFVQVLDDRTLLLPDRRGNNRIDSLRNVLADPRVALLFLIPGIGETLRVNGRAVIDIDPALLARFAVDGKAPRSVLRIAVEKVFFQCSRAVLRARLWDPGSHVERSALPSTGAMLAALSNGEVGGQQYDDELAGRLRTTMY